MGPQFNGEFTLSSWFFFCLTYNEVTTEGMSSSVLRSSLWWPLPLRGSYTSGGWPQVDFSPLLVHIWPIFDKQNKIKKNTLNVWKHEVYKQVAVKASGPLSACVRHCPYVMSPLCFTTGMCKMLHDSLMHVETYTARQIRWVKTTRERMQNTCSCRQHMHSAHSGHSDSAFKGSFWITELVIKLYSPNNNTWQVFEGLWLVFARTPAKSSSWTFRWPMRVVQRHFLLIVHISQWLWSSCTYQW